MANVNDIETHFEEIKEEFRTLYEMYPEYFPITYQKWLSLFLNAKTYDSYRTLSFENLGLSGTTTDLIIRKVMLQFQFNIDNGIQHKVGKRLQNFFNAQEKLGLLTKKYGRYLQRKDQVCLNFYLFSNDSEEFLEKMHQEYGYKPRQAWECLRSIKSKLVSLEMRDDAGLTLVHKERTFQKRQEYFSHLYPLNQEVLTEKQRKIIEEYTTADSFSQFVDKMEKRFGYEPYQLKNVLCKIDQKLQYKKTRKRMPKQEREFALGQEAFLKLYKDYSFCLSKEDKDWAKIYIECDSPKEYYDRGIVELNLSKDELVFYPEKMRQYLNQIATDGLADKHTKKFARKNSPMKTIVLEKNWMQHPVVAKGIKYVEKAKIPTFDVDVKELRTLRLFALEWLEKNESFLSISAIRLLKRFYGFGYEETMNISELSDAYHVSERDLKIYLLETFRFMLAMHTKKSLRETLEKKYALEWKKVERSINRHEKEL